MSDAYAAGLASLDARPFVGATDTPVTDKWRQQMQDAKAKLREKYSGPGPYKVATVLADVDHWWHVATQFAEQAPTLDMITPARVKQAKDNAVNLLEARAQLKTRRTDEIVENKDGAVYLQAMEAPIDWLVSVGSPVLKTEEKERSTLKTFLWVGAGLAALWGLSKLLSSGAEMTRELKGLRPPSTIVRNPPAWAADPEVWESARLAVEAHADQYDNPEAVKVHVYKQMGGRVS